VVLFLTLLVPGRLFRAVFGIALAAGLGIALVAPAGWTLSAVRNPEDAGYASAGPPLRGTGRGGSSPGGHGSSIPGGFGGAGAGLGSAELDWLRSQHDQERWIVAVPSDLTADDAIIAGDSVLPMGGFYGTDPAMTRTKLAMLVANKEVRFIDTGGFKLGDPNQIGQLVTQACTLVDPTAWHGTPPGSLYDCTGHQDAIRTVKLAAPATRDPRSSAAGGNGLGSPEAVQRLVTCLRAHGWNPTPNPDLSSPTVQKALHTCASLIPAATSGSPETGPS
jgi:hypothetical protein